MERERGGEGESGGEKERGRGGKGSGFAIEWMGEAELLLTSLT